MSESQNRRRINSEEFLTEDGPKVAFPSSQNVADGTIQKTSNFVEELTLKKLNRGQYIPAMDFSKKQNRDSISPELKEIRLTNIIDQLMSNRTKDVAVISGPLSDSQRSPGGITLNLSSKLESLSMAGSGPAGERQQSSGSPRGRDGLLTGSGSRSPEGGASSSLVQGQQPPTPARAPPPPRTPHHHRQPPPLPTLSPRAMPTDALASATSSAETSGNPAGGSGGTSGNLLLPKSSSSSSAAADRGTPEPESSSPSVSPHSPSPARGFPSVLAPGFGLSGLGALVRSSGGGTTAPFSPPPPSLERFSPANLAGGGAPAIKQMEMMTRNYSDFMRSLAAKYNNQNATQESFSMSQTNGLVRGFESAFPYKGSSPFLVRGLDVEGNGGCLSGSLGRKLDNQNSPTTPHDARVTNNSNSSIIGTAALGTCGGVADFSSSQTLLNLVRTASAQSASQLENYLKGAVKRTADGDSRIDPLDLSLSHSKRPKLEPRDFRDLLQAEAEAATTATGGDCPSNARTSVAKPAWMTLLDRRLHSSPTPSSRTSPKNTSSDRQHQRCLSMCTDKSCTAQSDASDVAHWTVEDVVKFVSSVDSCSEYAEKFRDQSIDGATLPLLTEDHLTSYLGLKLGPALKLRSTLARRIGHCAVCMHCIHCHGCATEDTSSNMDIVNRRHDSSSRSPSTVSK